MKTDETNPGFGEHGTGNTHRPLKADNHLTGIDFPRGFLFLLRDGACYGLKESVFRLKINRLHDRNRYGHGQCELSEKEGREPLFSTGSQEIIALESK